MMTITRRSKNMDKETIREMDKKIDAQILNIFGLDKVDEIILTKEDLKTKLQLIRLIFATELMKTILNSKDFKDIENEKFK